MLSAKKINRTNSMASQVGQLLAFAYSDHGLSLQGHVLIYNRSVFQVFKIDFSDAQCNLIRSAGK